MLQLKNNNLLIGSSVIESGKEKIYTDGSVLYWYLGLIIILHIWKI